MKAKAINDPGTLAHRHLLLSSGSDLFVSRMIDQETHEHTHNPFPYGNMCVETHLHMPAHTGAQSILTLILHMHIHTCSHICMCVYTHVYNPYTCVCPKEAHMEPVKRFSFMQDRGYNSKSDGEK